MLIRKPFITSTVGSFPQPPDLRKARLELARGQMTPAVYRDLYRNHAREWLEFQRVIGIDVLVGGEFERDDMAAYFGEFFGGRRLDFVGSYENRFYRPVEYFRKIQHPGGSLLGDDFSFYKSVSGRAMLKETITGPATMADWAIIRDSDYYHDRRKFRMDFAEAIRQEIDLLLPHGLEALQLDEPALTTSMDNFKMDLEAIHRTVSGLGDKLYLILHICYSNMEALDLAFPQILELPFHQVHMEMANRGYSLTSLIQKHGFGGKDIGLGVLDVHNDRVETAEEIAAGVKKILSLKEPGTRHPMFHPGQVWLTPDCGMKNDRAAKDKLRQMMAAARFCRKNLVQWCG